MSNIFWYTRIIFFYFIGVIATASLFPFLCFLHILKVPYEYKYFIGKIYSKWIIFLAKYICGLKYQVMGLEKLPQGPAVVMSNHQSFWENFFVQLIIPQHSWVIKKELLDIPVFGWGLGMVEPIAVDRTNSMSVNQITKSGSDKIKQGLWIIIFPESTRVKPNEYKKYKPSGVKLAIDNKIPIVLMAHNAGLFWPKAFWIKKPGMIRVEILSVIKTDKFVADDIRSLTADIEQQINQVKDSLVKLDTQI